MKNIILPRIVAIGVYNAELAAKNRETTKNRKTAMFEIELPLSEGGTSYIDGRSHRISENVVILAKPGQMRHTKLPFKCYYLHMMVDEGEVFDILSALPDYIEIENTEELQDIFISLCKYFDMDNPADDILLQSLILKLVHTLFLSSPSENMTGGKKRNSHKIIERAVEYINTSITQDLSLERLSELFNYTPIYFHKLFKQSTGTTLHKYVEEQRIRLAIDLMLSTEMTLTEIAYECGFSSQSYFNYAFRKRMGHTPREYTKNVLRKYESTATDE